ncbi:MAG TPA: trypsin-like peptidase domain-containing protein [Nitrolancea sp.]|nr:trypsin-like peptidase domain-containing protein [Nitrolancea sp.]
MIIPQLRQIGRRIPVLLVILMLATACSIGGGSNPTSTAASQSTAESTTTSSNASTASTGSSTTPTSNSTIKTSQPSTATSSSSASSSNQINPQDFSNAIVNVVNSVKSGVVEITNEQTSVSQMEQPIPVGTGSGFIYDSEGHILTNNHVVEGAQSLVVTLPDGRTFKGNDVKVVGTDPLTDLAVLKINGDNLPTVKLGNSSEMQVGQWVVAVGYALALEGQPTVTSGVVSAVDRTVQEPGDSSGNPFQQQQAGPFLFDVIQTDAAINPGNSGGPLVNLNGEVIGINTLEAGNAEPGVQAQGIGFAIAIDTAKKIANEIVTTGHATHPFVGVNYLALSPAAAAQLNISATQGALIESIVPGSPAEDAGLQKNDVVTKIDGKELTTESAFAETVDSHKPGDVITLTVERNGQEMTIKVTLGTRPSS